MTAVRVILAATLRSAATVALLHALQDDEPPYAHSDHYVAHTLQGAYASTHHDVPAALTMLHASTEMVAGVLLVIAIMGMSARLALSVAIVLFRCVDWCETTTVVIGLADDDTDTVAGLASCATDAIATVGARTVARNDGTSNDSVYGVEHASWLIASLPPMVIVDDLRTLLDKCRVEYGQDAIGLTIGRNETVS